jgi:hypothetical protein
VSFRSLPRARAFLKLTSLVCALPALVACGPRSERLPDPDGAAGTGPLAPAVEEQESSDPAADGGGSGDVLPPCTSGSAGVGNQPSAVEATSDSDDPSRQVCERWNADRAGLSEGNWSGSLEHCRAGELADGGIESALRMVNLYRWLAALPAVTTTPERNQIAQECALLQHANWRHSGLQHDPPKSWKCYSDDGAKGAKTSNISAGPGVTSVGAYMLDLGNEADLGHRRIILSNFLGPIGLGSTGPGGASCLQAIPGTGDAGKPWVAWPPPGSFPMGAYSYPPYSLDTTGWSIQSEEIDLSSADVEVTADGATVPVSVTALHGRYGSTDAIRIVPRGWRARSGETYAVKVTGISTPIEYQFELVDC